MPLKILQLADHSEIVSGGAMQMLLLARGLVERGHDVTCVFDDAPSPHEHTLQQVTDAGARLQRVPMHKKARSLGLRQLVAEARFDVIHTHRASYKVLLRSCTDLPVVVINRGHSRPVREREAERLAHPSVGAIVVVAAHVRDVLLQAGIPAARIAVIYGSYLTERFDPASVRGTAVRRELLADLDASTRLVGIIAKLSHYKSHDVFLHAAALVLQQMPDVCFPVVGPDPENARVPLLAQAEALGGRYGVPLVSRLRFTGARADIPQVLAGLDVSVSASATAWEGLSGVMRESLAMARPVVCTDVGGNREAVRDGDTGLLVPPGDPAALAAAILKLLHDPELAASLAQRGHRLAVETFSNPVRARTMEQLYRRLLDERLAMTPRDQAL